MVQKRVMVGMSGGVDSSVAALLLLEQGYHVEGLFMKNWQEDDGSEYCTAREDLADAQSVCDSLGIRLHQANFSAEYWDEVFDHFLREYRAGRTPNPDILCNKEIKFKAFLEYAQALGADMIATGHYALLVRQGDHVRLLKAKDKNKDQSYFLHAVSEWQFAKTLCPLGELSKSEVRRVAREHDFVTHDKKDSTGICFIGERRFADFLARYLPAEPGDIETTDGELLGQHNGLMFHTLGQRQGLGIGGVRDRKEAPWYVVDKDLHRNVLLVSQGNDHPTLYSNRLTTRRIDWIDGCGPDLPFHGMAKTRYRQEDQCCRLTAVDDHYLVSFDQPQRAVAPGQSVCFYSGETCLGGGVIESTGNGPKLSAGDPS
tara:strand:+ start:3551 stop:4666 length:1116 start_codon:yes stop_codon:yes gene_type:complete